jgi:hypothetical protein
MVLPSDLVPACERFRALYRHRDDPLTAAAIVQADCWGIELRYQDGSSHVLYDAHEGAGFAFREWASHHPHELLAMADEIHIHMFGTNCWKLMIDTKRRAVEFFMPKDEEEQQGFFKPELEL